MAEHYGSHVFVLGIIAFMIPSWIQDEQLKTATKTFLIAIFLYNNSKNAE